MIYSGSVDNWKEWLVLYKQGYRSVSGDFYCAGNNLTSMEFCPVSVGGDFNCAGHKLIKDEFYMACVLKGWI